MRTTIGNYDYLRNYDNIIDVFSYNGATDALVARFTLSGGVLISEVGLDTPDHEVMRDNAVAIFKGEITE